MSREVTLKQDCRVETWHNDQKLDEGFARAGDQITLLTGNGYRTVVSSRRRHEDDMAWMFGADRAAYDRWIADDYGPCW